MAKNRSACRYWLVGLGLLAAAASALSQAPAPAGVASAPHWLRVPKVVGRITARELGLVINSADPYSEQVGAYYIRQRKLRPEQVLRVELPLRPIINPAEFDALKRQIDDRFGPQVQALALAWTMPYAVQCNSITGALALGYDADLCQRSCARTRMSAYFNSPSTRPYTDLALRPSMLLAAPDVEQAKALIDRGVAADRSLGLRGAPPVAAYYVSTADKARNVRAPLFPPDGLVRRYGLDVKVVQGGPLQDAKRVLLYQTGAANVEHLDRIGWVDGALADHLTSFGGQLDRDGGQTTALAWIASGATASYGTVTEPCNHPQKFPHPQLLLLHYLQGSSAIEAYWKSVAWPQQGVFVGEPLAAPFAH